MNGTLKVDLFGGLKARFDDGAPVEFRPNFTGNLLAYLALHLGRSHPRDHLADILWPDEPDTESARHKLRQTLRQLRLKLDAIQPGLADLVIISSPSSVSLNPDSVVTDVGGFLRGIADSERSTNPTEWTAVLEQALYLYRAELLTGFYAEVFEREREHLASIYRSSRMRMRCGYES